MTRLLSSPPLVRPGGGWLFRAVTHQQIISLSHPFTLYCKISAFLTASGGGSRVALYGAPDLAKEPFKDVSKLK
jgi:hypothetical protein